jgi:hypothetical protein
MNNRTSISIANFKREHHAFLRLEEQRLQKLEQQRLEQQRSAKPKKTVTFSDSTK